jgi:hypothetical protein
MVLLMTHFLEFHTVSFSFFKHTFIAQLTFIVPIVMYVGGVPFCFSSTYYLFYRHVVLISRLGPLGWRLGIVPDGGGGTYSLFVALF